MEDVRYTYGLSGRYLVGACSWILWNCLAVVFWMELVWAWCLLLLGMLLWVVFLPALLWITWVQPASFKVRVGATAVILAGAYLGNQGSRWGPLLRVWWNASRYQQEAETALASQASGLATSGLAAAFGSWHVDLSDEPPVRAASFWFASHGDVDGFVYDPTGQIGQIGDSRHPWLYGSRTWHLFGPWYRCRN